MLPVKENQAYKGRGISMRTRYFALILGIFILLLGLSGFVPNLLTLPNNAPAIKVDAGYGYQLGLFPTNVIFNLIKVAVGALGIAAFWSFGFARSYAQIVAISYALLAVLGLIPGANTMFGLIPIFGNNVWFHGVTAAIAAYIGFVEPVSPQEVNEAGRRIA
ncbi:hypothetical protein NIES4073_52070 [Kalymmatonema gypsitolerans NIES-4073]|nr:hypothetical protein NIES4073_52070 [Scytonema sp. NIES-4073]